MNRMRCCRKWHHQWQCLPERMSLSHPQTQPKTEPPKKCKYFIKATGNASTAYMYVYISIKKQDCKWLFQNFRPSCQLITWKVMLLDQWNIFSCNNMWIQHLWSILKHLTGKESEMTCAYKHTVHQLPAGLATDMFLWCHWVFLTI